MEVPDRNPVKWNGTLVATSNQCCHFSCQPTPSKLTTMNCGGFSPGASFFGTKPSGSAAPSAAAGVAALDAAGEPGVAVSVVGLGDAAGSELGSAEDGAAVTK